MSIWNRKKPSFGFVSTRFAGTDGVSLETEKWVEVLSEKGCKVFHMAGMLDTDPESSYLAPKTYFQHADIQEIQQALFDKKNRSRDLTNRVHQLKEECKDELYKFQDRFGFDILVVQNALAIPVNIPLGVALTEFIIETGIPTIAHHHDFYWERQRFRSFETMDYLRAAFPPVHPNIQHVVINSIAGEQLADRTGENWALIPNVMDFKTEAPGQDEYNQDFRSEIGVDDDALLVLQPTRIVARKGIETAIELVKRLDYPKSVLVISHNAGDEGLDYLNRVVDYAQILGVEIKLISDRIAKNRGHNDKGEKLYTLWDVYPHVDLVTFPSTYEGYGNALVEAIYFRKPVVVNRYAIFEADIEPKGFDVIAMNGFVTDEVVENVHQVLENPDRKAKMIETNYLLGWRYLSHEMLEEQLETLLINIYGSHWEQIAS